MGVNLLIEHHLEFLSLKRGCTGLSESKLAKMPHCWKSNVAAQLLAVSINVKPTPHENLQKQIVFFAVELNFNVVSHSSDKSSSDILLCTFVCIWFYNINETHRYNMLYAFINISQNII